MKLGNFFGPDMKPYVTLFMLMSMDGKISTGYGNSYDVDKDFPTVTGVKEGLHQYYEKEQETDLWSLVTGKTMAKIGINSGTVPMAKVPGLHRVILGVRELKDIGIQYIVEHSEYTHFIIRGEADLRRVTNALRNATNKYTVKMLKSEYTDPKIVLGYLSYIGCKELTLQAGSTVNGAFAMAHVIDRVHVVVAPVIVGGNSTPGIVGGVDRVNGLGHLNVLKLVSATPLKNSYLDLIYDVVK